MRLSPITVVPIVVVVVIVNLRRSRTSCVGVGVCVGPIAFDNPLMCLARELILPVHAHAQYIVNGSFFRPTGGCDVNAN